MAGCFELMACATAVHVMKKSIFAFSLSSGESFQDHTARTCCCCETHNAHALRAPKHDSLEDLARSILLSGCE